MSSQTNSSKRVFKFAKKQEQKDKRGESQASLPTYQNLAPQDISTNQSMKQLPKEIQVLVMSNKTLLQRQQHHPLIEQVKSFVLCQNFSKLLKIYQHGQQLTQKTALDGQVESSTCEAAQSESINTSIKQSQQKTEIQFSNKNLLFDKVLSRLDKGRVSKELVMQYWSQVKDQVNESLSFFDSLRFCQRQAFDQNQIPWLQIKMRPLPGNKTIFDQLGMLVTQVFQMLSYLNNFEKEEPNQSKVSLVMSMKGIHLHQGPQKYTTYSIDFEKLFNLLISVYNAATSNQRQQCAKELYKLLGVDTTGSGDVSPNNIVHLSISKASLQSQRVPSFMQKNMKSQASAEQRQTKTAQTPVEYQQIKSLFSISRARVQYIGAVIPLFKFKHSLLEALISAIHEEQLRPAFMEDERETLQETVNQERFLLKSYIEFLSHPFLSKLLELSEQGKTLEFVDYFNQLSEDQTPWYSKYNLSLYDINQRKYVVLNDQAPQIFIVHYNGFVFSSNYPKMMIIRELEIGLHDSQPQQDTVDLLSLDNKSFDSDRSEKAENEELKSFNVEGAQEAGNQGQEDAKSDQGVNDDDDRYSDIDMRTSFMLTHKFFKQTRKYKQNEDPSVMTSKGFLAFKIGFKKIKAGPQLFKQEPSKLVCYGNLPSQQHPVIKIFEGAKCHLQFLTWLLQNTIDYTKDARKDVKQLTVFCCNGSHKELPLVLQAMVQIAGRDAHFLGDLNKLKLVWYENVKFFDITNFFEGRSLQSLAADWLKPSKKDFIKAKSQDKTIRDVLLTYEVVNKFISELQSINFNTKKYDFAFYSQSGASSLALSIYQYFYLDHRSFIRGTWGSEVFFKEKQSLKAPNIKINNLSKQSIDFSNNIYRLYGIKYSMTQVQKESPIPYMFKCSQAISIEIDFKRTKCTLYNQPFKSLGIRTQLKSYIILYTSLYKVNKIVKKGGTLTIPDQSAMGLDYSAEIIEDTYIWGVELIHALLDSQNTQSIQYIKISEEIIYYQHRRFASFISDIWDQLLTSRNTCQKDILEMILSTFANKFSQKYFSYQQIIHINDLRLMKQTMIQDESQIIKMVEIKYPYYYIEFYSNDSEPLLQVGSLTRITSYLNACHRVKTINSLVSIDFEKNLVYLDSDYLLLKNKWLVPTQTSQSFKEMGKWRLLNETVIETGGNSDKSNKELQIYAEYFKHKNLVGSFADLKGVKQDCQDHALLREFDSFKQIKDDKEQLLEQQIKSFYAWNKLKSQTDNQQELLQLFIERFSSKQVKVEHETIKEFIQKYQTIERMQLQNPEEEENHVEAKDSSEDTELDFLADPSQLQEFISTLDRACLDFESRFNQKKEEEQQLSQKLVRGIGSQQHQYESSSDLMSQDEIMLAMQLDDTNSQMSQFCGTKRGRMVENYFSQSR